MWANTTINSINFWDCVSFLIIFYYVNNGAWLRLNHRRVVEKCQIPQSHTGAPERPASSTHVLWILIFAGRSSRPSCCVRPRRCREHSWSPERQGVSALSAGISGINRRHPTLTSVLSAGIQGRLHQPALPLTTRGPFKHLLNSKSLCAQNRKWNTILRVV